MILERGLMNGGDLSIGSSFGVKCEQCDVICGVDVDSKLAHMGSPSRFS